MLNEIKDIYSSIWISASAGTGKTKSIMDRIISLLLHRVNPSHILCLTYTNAAATEMSERLIRSIYQISNTNLSELRKDFPSVDEDLINQLIKQSTNSKSWVNIQTIHSFCFSILKKFPLETQLLPGITLCDDFQKQALWKEAISITMNNDHFQEHWLRISEYLSDIFIEDHTLLELEKFLFGIQDFEKKYADCYDIDIDLLHLSEEQKVQFIVSKLEDKLHINHKEMFQNLANGLLKTGKSTDAKKANILLNNINSCSASFIDAFLTKDGTYFSKLCTKNTDEHTQKNMEKTAILAQSFFEMNKRIEAAKFNVSYFSIINDILKNFRTLKQQHHCIDYNDIIHHTTELLHQFDWVRYKIDNGIHHILIDEAQDTSPAQWQIIQQLTQDFFSHHKSTKTIFVVGDSKQSIYSFQGANLAVFQQQLEFFKSAAKQCGQTFHEVTLNKSYRTTSNILSFVDDVFKDIFANTKHISNRIDQQDGIIQIWDPFEDEEESDLETDSAAFKLAYNIAQQIEETIKQRVFVPSKNRSVAPEDFLILFRRRDVKVMELIIDQLHLRNIPVGDIDRIVLGEDPIVEDLICLATFVLSPYDDLTCARVLKSPIIGIDDEQLLTLCNDRKNTNLWESIQDLDFATSLKTYIDLSTTLSAYNFFTHVLNDGNREKFISRLGAKCLDKLDKFLQLILQYESNNTPSLSAFLRWFDSFEHQVKSENQLQENCVRLMTVHSSKGLQSPFVILADTHFIKHRSNQLISLDNGDFVWDFDSSLRPYRIKQACDELKKMDQQESLNLLYVAMTRAEDFLWIFAQKNKMHENCWYNYLISHINSDFLKNDTVYTRGNFTFKDNSNHSTINLYQPKKLPDWFFKKEEKTIAKSHFQSIQTIYGDYVHELLRQHISNIPPLPNKYFSKLNDNQKQQAMLEVENIITKFPYLFKDNSLSEIQFVYKGRLGRIDLLAFINNEIWIIDFKSGHPIKPTPKNYLKQLYFYKDFITNSKQFKNNKIKIAILWTKSAELHELTCE